MPPSIVLPPVKTQAIYGEMILSDSPSAYWPLTEVSGSLAYDVSGQLKHGTYTGAVQQIGGTNPLGAPAPLFSASGWVELPQGLVSNARTVEAWVFSNSPSPGVVVGYQSGSVNGTFSSWSLALYLTLSGFLSGELYFGDSNNPPMGNVPINNGTWRHIALVVHPARQELYLDGVQVVSRNGAIVSGLGMIYNQIGTGMSSSWGDAPGGWYGFSGLISNVALYSDPLDPGRIASHAAYR